MILTIGITSYNRVNELERCLRSIDTKYDDDIEVLVSEDCSPLHSEIERMVLNLNAELIYDIRFCSNENNLGYDRNLGEIIKKAQGHFVLLMSCDDMLYPNQLDNIINVLKNNQKCGLLYLSYIYGNTKKLDRFHSSNLLIEASFRNAGIK